MNIMVKRLLTALVGALGALLASLTSMEGGMDMTLGQLGEIPLVAWLGVVMAFMTGYLNSEDLRMPSKSAAALLVGALVLPLVISLPGCTYLKDSVAEATGQAPAKTLQQRIDDAKILVVAASDEIADGVVAGYVAVDEAQAQLNQVKDANEKVTQAQTLLRLGDPTSAEGQLAIANTALDLLRKEIARKAREAKQQ